MTMNDQRIRAIIKDQALLIYEAYDLAAAYKHEFPLERYLSQVEQVIALSPQDLPENFVAFVEFLDRLPLCIENHLREFLPSTTDEVGEFLKAHVLNLYHAFLSSGVFQVNFSESDFLSRVSTDVELRAWAWGKQSQALLNHIIWFPLEVFEVHLEDLIPRASWDIELGYEELLHQFRVFFEIHGCEFGWRLDTEGSEFH
jgi:hypothetical protein